MPGSRRTTLRRSSDALRRICALAVTAVALACLGIAGTAAGAVKRNAHGIVSAINGFSLFEGPISDWNRQMAAMHADGVRVVRSDAAWEDIQPQPPTSSGPRYQWSIYDTWVSDLASNGLTWQPIIDYNTRWTTAIADNAGFAAFARAVAARYGAGRSRRRHPRRIRRGTFWADHPRLPYHPAAIFEIWNEEGGAPTYISPRHYGRLYTTASNAIHDVDPSASVDVGGLGIGGIFKAAHDWPVWYLRWLFRLYPKLEHTVDGFALHPYGADATDSAEWVAAFRSALTSFHVPTTVPIDLTEFGWPQVAGKESWRATQMTALGDVFSRSNCGIREVAPYDWINPTSVGDLDFGFVHPSETNTRLTRAGRAWFSSLSKDGSESTYKLCKSKLHRRHR